MGEMENMAQKSVLISVFLILLGNSGHSHLKGKIASHDDMGSLRVKKERYQLDCRKRWRGCTVAIFYGTITQAGFIITGLIFKQAVERSCC